MKLESQFQGFLYQTLFLFSQIKDIKYIDLNFHSVNRSILACVAQYHRLLNRSRKRNMVVYIISYQSFDI